MERSINLTDQHILDLCEMGRTYLQEAEAKLLRFEKAFPGRKPIEVVDDITTYTRRAAAWKSLLTQIEQLPVQ